MRPPFSTVVFFPVLCSNSLCSASLLSSPNISHKKTQWAWKSLKHSQTQVSLGAASQAGKVRARGSDDPVRSARQAPLEVVAAFFFFDQGVRLHEAAASAVCKDSCSAKLIGVAPS